MPPRSVRLPPGVLRALLCLIAAACGDAPRGTGGVIVDTLPGGVPRTISSVPLEVGRWSLEVVREVGPDEGSVGELIAPGSLALADDGSLIVADARPTVLKVFDPSGGFVRSIGRSGAGPGEFRAAFIAVRGDTLIVQDPSNARALMIAWRAGEVLAMRPTACCYWSPVDVDAAGRAWLRTIASLPDTALRHGQGFVRMALGSGVIDTVFAYERPHLPTPSAWQLRDGDRMILSTSVPLSPRAHFVIEPTGGLLSGWSAEYSIRVSRTGRDTVAVFGRRWDPPTVTAAERDRVFETVVRQFTTGGSRYPEQAVRASFDKGLIPAARPAYDALHADEAGRRWVRRSLADTTRVEFDVFDAEGRWLDAVGVAGGLWPQNVYAPVDFARNEVAVLVEAGDGRPLVRVFAIRRR